MKFPSKVTPYKESSIAKFPSVLELLQKADMTPKELYAELKKKKISDISEFADILDCLFAMHKIELHKEVLHYVG